MRTRIGPFHQGFGFQTRLSGGRRVPRNTVGVVLDAGVKIFGGWSRAYALKSLSILARGRYRASEIVCPLFPGRNYDTYQLTD